MTSTHEGQHFDHTTVSGNARAHIGNVYHNYGSSARNEEAETRCRSALFLTDPANDRQRLIDRKGERVTGTCEWLLDHETYRTWLADTPGLLWVSGKPGKGKTMLSIFLTQRLERDYGNNAIYYFCNSVDEQQSTSTAVLRGLIWQILHKRPELTESVSSYFNPPERTAGVLSTPGTLWKVFVQLAQYENPSSLYCLIDGLDECDNASARWLATQLAGHTRENKQGGLRIIVVSRDMLEFKSVRSISLDSDNGSKVSSDVESFTSTRMTELSQLLDLTDEFKAQIQSELLRKAEGTFLWVGYALNELFSLKTSSQVQEAVSDMPAELPALYRRMLRRIPQHQAEIASLVLRWVVLAARPLSPAELAYLITWHMPKTAELTRTTQDYIKLCEPFIFLAQTGTLMVVHQSVKDFLLISERHGDPAVEKFLVKTVEDHFSLADICLKSLETQSEFEHYASKMWPYHMKRCAELTTALIEQNRNFFGKKSRLRQQWLLHYGWSSTRRENTPRLHIACYYGLKQWVEILIRSRIPVLQPWKRVLNQRSTFYKRTPLHFAVKGYSSRADADFLRYLLAQGADPDIKDRDDQSPLQCTAYAFVPIDIFKLLLAHSSNPNSALTACVFGSLTDRLKLLIKAGADISSVQDVWLPGFASRATCLHVAVHKQELLRPHDDSFVAMVSTLLDYGADPSIRDNHGKTAAQCTKSHRARQLYLKLLKEYGHSVTEVLPALDG